MEKSRRYLELERVYEVLEDGMEMVKQKTIRYENQGKDCADLYFTQDAVAMVMDETKEKMRMERDGTCGRECECGSNMVFEEYDECFKCYSYYCEDCENEWYDD